MLGCVDTTRKQEQKMSKEAFQLSDEEIEIGRKFYQGMNKVCSETFDAMRALATTSGKPAWWIPTTIANFMIRFAASYYLSIRRQIDGQAVEVDEWRMISDHNYNVAKSSMIDTSVPPGVKPS